MFWLTWAYLEARNHIRSTH